MAAADVDDELLALAGDASSSENGNNPSSPPDAGSSTSRKRPSTVAGGPGVGVGTKKRKTASATGKTESKGDDSDDKFKEEGSDEEEDGEDIGAKDGSTTRISALATTAEEGYEDAEGSEDDEDEDVEKQSGRLYPIEGIYKDEEDRERLLNLPELEREAELSERREVLSKLQQKAQLAAMVRSQRAAGATSAKKQPATKASQRRKSTFKSKRRDDADDSDESSESDEGSDYGSRARTSNRQRRGVGANETKSDKLKELQRRRRAKAEGKGLRGNRADDVPSNSRKSRPDLDSSDESSESSAYVDSEEEGRMHRVGKAGTREGPYEPPTLNDLNATRIGRNDVIKMIYKPGWEKMLVGNFIRLVVAPQRNAHGQMEQRYRAYEIIGTYTRSRYYDVEGGRYTNIHLKLRFGDDEHTGDLSTISNSPISESEFNRWKLTMDAAKRHKPPSKARLEMKREEFNEWRDQPFTETMITARINAKNEAQRAFKEQRGHAFSPSSPSTRGVPTQSNSPASNGRLYDENVMAEMNERHRRLEKERIQEAEKAQAKARRAEMAAAIAAQQRQKQSEQQIQDSSFTNKIEEPSNEPNSEVNGSATATSNDEAKSSFASPKPSGGPLFANHVPDIDVDLGDF